MNNYKFSIIIPMHNVEKYIISALDSINNQVYKNYECIIVDDHSNDNSLDIVKAYLNKNSNLNFKIFSTSKDKWGPGAARNIALDVACGDYIIFLDSDDSLCSSNVLKNINNELNQKNLDILLLNYITKYRDRNNKELLSIASKNNNTDIHYFMSKSNGIVWNICWNRDLFDDIKFIENDYWEDLIPKLQLFNKCNEDKIGVCEFYTHEYNIRPGSSVGSTPNIEKIKSIVKLNKRCYNLIKEGKIDQKYEKDLNKRCYSTFILLVWMLARGSYSKILKDIPESVDDIKRKILK